MKTVSIIILVGLFVFAGCHKKKNDPAPVVDYSDSLTGTYLGTETVYQGAPAGPVSYNNTSKTITIVKINTNRIQIKGLNSGGAYYDCSATMSGYITLTAESPVQNYGSFQNNSYRFSDKQLLLDFKFYPGDYDYFMGTKQ